MEQLELEIETEEEKLSHQQKKAKLMELFRKGNEASWTKFLKSDEAQRILNDT